MKALRTKDDAWRAGYARAQQQAVSLLDQYVDVLKGRAEYDSARYFIADAAEHIASEQPWFADVGLPFAPPVRQPSQAA